MLLFRVLSVYGRAFLLLFLLITAAAWAVEEDQQLRLRSPLKQWCHARAFINFNTWALLVNLGNTISAGEQTLTNAEKLDVEEESQYRLRKAVFDANRARAGLLNFVEHGAVTTSDPWPTDHNEYVPPSDPKDFVDPDGARTRESGDSAVLSRPVRVIPICVAVGVAIAAAVAGATALSLGIYAVHRSDWLEQQLRWQMLQMDEFQERTAHVLAQAGITTKELEDNFDKTDANVAMLINRTEQLAFAYRTRTDMFNSITVLENLAAIARDLPHLVATVNATGRVDPAYVPEDVWRHARELLHHDERGHRVWLPEADGANATWIHRNQTLIIQVPASCDVDPSVYYLKKEMRHFNTSLVLRFSQWTDAQVLETEELRKYRKLAEETARAIQDDRVRNQLMLGESHSSVKSASVATTAMLFIIGAILCAAMYYINKKRNEMAHMLAKFQRTQPRGADTQTDNVYSNVDETRAAGTAGLAATVYTHAANAAQLALLREEQRLQEVHDRRAMPPPV